MKPTWQSIGFQNEVLVDDTGRIVGEIQGTHYGSRWIVLGGGGTYISAESAKAAVERRWMFEAMGEKS